MDYKTAILDPRMGWLLLGLFSVAWVALGIYWGKKAKDLEGFMLAGRNVGFALGAATAMATWVTSNTIMLTPMFALQMGIWGMLAYSTASFGLFLFAPMAYRIRTLMPKGYTSGDFIRLRYGKVAWVLFLIISVVYSVGWLASMGMAGGFVLKALSGIPFEWGMSVILLVCVIYTLFGGLYAVIGTDFIQSIIILIGVLFVGGVILVQVDIHEVYTNVTTYQPALLDIFMPVALLSVFNNMFFGFGEIFHNNVWWSRAFAMREGVPHKAYFLAGFLWLPIPVAAGFFALAAFTLDINITDPNLVGPLVAGKVLGSVGAIVVFVVIFSSLASSIDSLLAATADLVTEDIVGKMIAPGASSERLHSLSTWVILGLGAVTWVMCTLAHNAEANLNVILFASGPLVGSAIWPVIGGLYWKSASRIGAIAAMLSGSIVGLIIYFQGDWFYASLVSAAISMVVMCTLTKLAPTPFDWNDLDESALHDHR